MVKKMQLEEDEGRLKGGIRQQPADRRSIRKLGPSREEREYRDSGNARGPQRSKRWQN